MAYYHVCPFCGANLDPGEHCDCKEKATPGEEDRKVANQNSSNTVYHT